LGFKFRGLGIAVLCFVLSACAGNKTKTIGVVTYNQFNTSHKDSIQAALQRAYGFRVVHLYDSQMPNHTFINVKSPRYRADKLIKHLKQTKPDNVDFMLGLTAKDISTTKRDQWGRIKEPKARYEDFGIFGLGYRPGVSCIVSSYRLGRGRKKKIKIERLQKICIHEIGHNLGLKHCPNKECVMTSAVEKLSTVDHAQMKLCAVCQKKVK